MVAEFSQHGVGREILKCCWYNDLRGDLNFFLRWINFNPMTPVNLVLYRGAGFVACE
jgi:hypothetical protein